MQARHVTAIALACVSGLAAWATPVDPVRVSPEAYVVRFENERFRVLELTLAPGARDELHGHPDGIYRVLAGGTVRIERPGGAPRDVELATGRIGRQSPVELHRIENIGETTLRVLMIEDRRPDPDDPLPSAGQEPDRILEWLRGHGLPLPE